MSLRGRVALATAVAVALAIAGASVVVFVFARQALYSEIDRTLQGNAVGVVKFTNEVSGVAGSAAALPPAQPPVIVINGQACGTSVSAPVPAPNSTRGSFSARADQVIGRLSDWKAGFVCLSDPKLGEPLFPVDPKVRAVAEGLADADVRTVRIDGQPYRAITLRPPDGRGMALQSARPLVETERQLSRLRWLLVAVTIVGAAVAALVGWLVSGPAIAPVRRLVEATEHVSATGDLRRRVEVSGGDDLARLGRSFNAMLAALELAQGAQRQLVADASHELRTPITSVRTNLEVLRSGRLGPRETDELLRDVVRQLDELGQIVSDVIDLARDEPTPAAFEPVRLDEVCHEAVARMRRHVRDVTIELATAPSVVVGVPDRLARAVGNLLDNAVKWSPPGGIVEVAVADGVVRVADRGPGIDPDEAERLFDRFYRAAAARSRPGSGLGLAIVRQVALEHGGSASIAPRPGGGAVAVLTLGATAPDAVACAEPSVTDSEDALPAAPGRA